MIDEMGEFRVRIGAIRGKNGAVLNIVAGSFEDRRESVLIGDRLIEAMDTIAGEAVTSRISGFAIVTWDDRSRATVAYLNGRNSSISSPMVGTYVGKVLDHFVAVDAAEDRLQRGRR